MRFYSIFGAVLRKFIANVVVLRFYNTKRFNFNTVFRNFRVISMRFSYVFLCGVYTYFCAVLRYSCPPYAPHLRRRRVLSPLVFVEGSGCLCTGYQTCLHIATKVA